MTNLKTLKLAGSTINDDGIRNLTQLEELHISYNKMITDINHMTKLKILNLFDCNIDNGNTTDTQRKRSIMLLHDDIFRDIFIVHIFIRITINKPKYGNHIY